MAMVVCGNITLKHKVAVAHLPMCNRWEHVGEAGSASMLAGGKPALCCPPPGNHRIRLLSTAGDTEASQPTLCILFSQFFFFF